MGMEELKGKIEKVGKVTLDLTEYPGEDLYCDGAIEDELLEIARDRAPVEFPSIIEEKKNWPVLYHLSTVRENIVRWIPFKKTDKVLEVGAGCGAITGALCELAGEVVSCDLSKKRSMINAYRHAECENLNIHVGNFTDVEKNLDDDFDYICLIGVFEYGSSYINSETPYEDFLNLLKRHLKPGGRIIIAIENRLGLKYFAGCKEDHLGTWFSSLTGYSGEDGVQTFSRPRLIKIFDKCGMDDYHFYYPYPDYKLMHTLYSDERLPHIGELYDNERNFDRDRMELFNEKKAFDELIRDGLFKEFSNSFLVVLGPSLPIEYARFSNDRAPEYQIETVVEKSLGQRVVKKMALHPEGYEHIRKMKDSCEALKKRYEGSGLTINECHLEETNNVPVAVFDFEEGVTLTELLDRRIKQNDEEGFAALFDKYVELTGYNETEPVSDQDLCFSNILVRKDSFVLIDYEWTIAKAVPVRETAFRAVYCYLLEEPERNKLNLDLIFDRLGISDEEAGYLREDEHKFQKFVTGRHLALGEMRNAIGNAVYDPVKLLETLSDHRDAYRFQVYEENSAGTFDEEHSYFIDGAYLSDDRAEVSIAFSGDANSIRIDPLMESCMVIIKECLVNGREFNIAGRKSLLVNGRRVSDDSFVFETNDPNMVFVMDGVSKTGTNSLDLKLEIIRLPGEAAQRIEKNIKHVF